MRTFDVPLESLVLSILCADSLSAQDCIDSMPAVHRRRRWRRSAAERR